MTVLYSSIHAWAAAFCPGCEKLVHYQASDVRPVVVSAPTSYEGGVAERLYHVLCKCGHLIEIARTT